jgi:hypothetical protein
VHRHGQTARPFQSGGASLSIKVRGLRWKRNDSFASVQRETLCKDRILDVGADIGGLVTIPNTHNVIKYSGLVTSLRSRRGRSFYP